MQNSPPSETVRDAWEFNAKPSNEEQFARARRLIRGEAQDGEPARISLLVLLETEWVLRSRYKLSKAEILGAFSELLSAVDMSFEDESSIEEALPEWLSSRDCTCACWTATPPERPPGE